MIGSIFKALYGRMVWQSMRRRFKIRAEDFLVLLPEREETLNRCVLENLAGFKEKKYIPGIVVAHLKEEPLAEVRGDYKTAALSRRAMEALVSYNCLCPFKKNLVTASLEAPFGSRGLIGHKGISLEDMVRDGILF